MKKVLFGALVATTALFAACDNNGPAKVNLKTDVDTLSYALGVANSPASPDEIKAYLIQSGSDSAYVEAFFKGMKEGLRVAEDKKEMAYQLGVQAGLQIKTRMFTGVESQVFAGDSTQRLSTKQFLAGLMDGYANKAGLLVKGDTITREKMQPFLMNLMNTMTAKANEKVYGDAKKKSEAYIAAKAKEAGVKLLAGGVYYKEIKAGTGATPTENQTVEVQYEGKLINGTVFDSSQDKTVEFPCNAVIKGWTIALTKMKEGAEWEVYIPWNLAYGANAQGPIPPYSALTFKIKLVKVKAAAAAPAAPAVQMVQ